MAKTMRQLNKTCIRCEKAYVGAANSKRCVPCRTPRKYKKQLAY